MNKTNKHRANSDTLYRHSRREVNIEGYKGWTRNIYLSEERGMVD